MDENNMTAPATTPATTPTETTAATIETLATKHKVLIGCLAGAVIILSLLSTFLGYEYKKETKVNISLSTENDTLKQQQATHTNSTTVTEPVEVAGKIVYRTIVRYIHDTASDTETTHNAAVSTYVKTVTVTEKDFATFGIGLNLYQDVCILAQKDILHTPLGTVGIEIVPDAYTIKRSSGFITWKP